MVAEWPADYEVDAGKPACLRVRLNFEVLLKSKVSKILVESSGLEGYGLGK